MPDRHRDTDAIRASEQQSRSILAAIPDPLFTLNRDWNFVYANPAAERLFGRAQGDLLGTSIWECPAEIISADVERLYRQVASEQVSGSLTTHLSDLSCWYEIRVFPSEDGLTIYFRDISEAKEAEAARRTSDERWRIALDSAGLGSWSVDPASGEMTTDEQFRRIFSGRPDAMSYEVAIATIHPDDRSRVIESVAAAMRTEISAPYSEEYRVIHADGSIHWVFAQGRSNFSSDAAEKRVISFDGTVADVSDRRNIEEQLQTAEEQFRALANNMLQFTWTADATGSIYWYNDRWYDYTGTTLEEMKGWGWQSVHHPAHVKGVVARFQQAIDREEPWEDTFPLRSRDGVYRWFLSRAQPIRSADGKLHRWFGTNTDVTEQRDNAEKLRQLVAALSNADRRKDEFLSILAHELRNPLAPLSTGLQIMKLVKDNPAAVEDARSMMERQLSVMVRLVDDLMDVSRITQGKVELRREYLDLARVVEQAIETSRPLLEKSKNALTINGPVTPVFVHGDAVRLAQILANLLSNAAKYSDIGGRITLTIEQQGNDAIVRVADTGVGIPSQMLPHVFDLFTQVDRSLEKAQGGLGIGLALVKGLIELHSGSVDAVSDGPGCGCVFTVRLPVASPVTKNPASHSLDDHLMVAHRRLLVADDNVDAAYAMRTLLGHMGHEVVTAHDGAEAVARAEEFRPHLILLDIGMPKLNGYEVCQRIREQPWGKSTRIVALTGWGQKEDRQRSTDAGFDHHLVKPVNAADLEQLLVKFAGRRSADH